MVDIINIVVAALSIAFGAIGWFAPRWTMEIIDMLPGPSSMAPSEIRAASGALYVGIGIGALLIGGPAAYAMVGLAWGGAAVGRATSIVLDGATPLKWKFFATEAVVAAVALAANLPALTGG